MSNEKIEDKYLNKFTKEFDDLVSTEKMNINSNVINLRKCNYKKLHFFDIIKRERKKR